MDEILPSVVSMVAETTFCQMYKIKLRVAGLTHLTLLHQMIQGVIQRKCPNSQIGSLDVSIRDLDDMEVELIDR